MNKILQFVAPVALSMLLLACGSKQNNDQIPADVVNNPNTASGQIDKNSLPIIVFEKDFHDFGKLMAGEQVTYAFKFKNTGKSLLLISNVSTSCGCTVSDYPKTPIKPGESGTIDVSFNSEGRHGMQSKTITVFSNTQPPATTLRILSQVVDPDSM